MSSEYIGAAFSDHMLHLVRLECPEATEAAEDHFKPYFKISPETAKDAEFQDRVQQQAAKQISRERAKEKRATLTFLMLVQSHLSKKTSKGNLSLLPKLKSIQLRINNWFDEQAEKVRLHSRLKDKSLRKSGSTTMSSSTEPTIKAQSPSSKHHWGSSVATKSVQTFSTKMCQLYLRQRQNWSKQHKDNCWMKLKKAKDNEMLEAEITDEEVRESLKTSNKKAAPGGDGMTVLVYDLCWSSLGQVLCNVIREVAKAGTPTESMKHSFMVFSPKLLCLCFYGQDGLT